MTDRLSVRAKGTEVGAEKARPGRQRSQAADDSILAIVGKACIYCFRVKQISQMEKAGGAIRPVDVEAILFSVSNWKQDQLILELKVIAKASVKHLSQRTTLRVVINTLRMQEPFHALS